MYELIPCKHMFSNGSEYEYFLETQCERCTRFRKGYCRTYRRTEMARFDAKYFPYDDLLDIKGYAGKVCKRFTDEKFPRMRKQKPPEQLEGQLTMEDMMK